MEYCKSVLLLLLFVSTVFSLNANNSRKDNGRQSCVKDKQDIHDILRDISSLFTDVKTVTMIQQQQQQIQQQHYEQQQQIQQRLQQMQQQHHEQQQQQQRQHYEQQQQMQRQLQQMQQQTQQQNHEQQLQLQQQKHDQQLLQTTVQHLQEELHQLQQQQKHNDAARDVFDANNNMKESVTMVCSRNQPMQSDGKGRIFVGSLPNDEDAAVSSSSPRGMSVNVAWVIIWVWCGLILCTFSPSPLPFDVFAAIASHGGM